ncbi:MAG: M20 family metallo-hydrolase, partial [Halopseudomonas sp.]
DTQPTGGKFDGIYGVLAGVEVMTTLEEQGITTDAPLEVVVWTNEEGARFSPAMIGSGVWSGVFDLEYGHSRTDKQGRSIQQELERIGYLGTKPASARPIKAAFELHIEQGPILEQEQKQIGIVSGVQGMRWYDLILEGEPRHAGPTPMDVRRDPFMALQPILKDLYQLAEDKGPWARATFGDIKAEPGARNTVPERLTLAVDLRHPEQAQLDQMDQRLRSLVEEVARQTGVTCTVNDEWNSAAVNFDSGCVAAVQAATESLGLSHKHMFSGAGHDAVYLSQVAPTSMIFVPCENGISHNEAENAVPADITAGANVLLQAMLTIACAG